MKTKTLCLVAVVAALLNTAGCSGDNDSVKQADLEKICGEDMSLGFHFYRTLSANLARRLRNTSDFVAHFKGMSQRRR